MSIYIDGGGRTMKRTIAIAALCAGIMLTTFPCQAKESGNLKINAKNFPDTIVREYVAEKIDKNNDGYLSKKRNISSENNHY